MGDKPTCRRCGAISLVTMTTSNGTIYDNCKICNFTYKRK